MIAMMYVHCTTSKSTITEALTLVNPRDDFVEALTGAATTIAQGLDPHTSPVQQHLEGENVAVSPLRMTTTNAMTTDMVKQLLEDGVLTEIGFTEGKKHIHVYTSYSLKI